MMYVGLLRGVNVGGKTLKMAPFAKYMADAGFKNPKTILASGNVLFQSAQKDARKIAAQIEALIESKFKMKVRVIVRPVHDLEMLVKTSPFKNIEVTQDTRLYVTFLDRKPAKHLKTVNEFFRVTKTCPFAVCTVITLTADKGSLDLMGTLEKHYGKNVTTRNWNTIQKILKAAI